MATLSGSGIGGYDLAVATDQIIAYDYDGTGKLDHLVCYRPGPYGGWAPLWILKKDDSYSPDAFAAVYQEDQIMWSDPSGSSAPSQSGGGMAAGVGQVFAYDYDGTGKLDCLVLYYPGTGRVYGLKKDDDGPAGVVTVYGTTPGSGIGGFDLLDSRDRLFAFDYSGTGTLDHLVCYRPGTACSEFKEAQQRQRPDAFAVFEGGGIFLTVPAATTRGMPRPGHRVRRGRHRQARPSGLLPTRHGDHFDFEEGQRR
jgi:hypothetical protein